MTRYESTGALDELDRAVAAFTDVVSASPSGAPGHLVALDGLATALRERHLRRDDPADLVAATTVAEEAVAATGSDAVERGRRLTTLANCLATGPGAADRMDRIVALYDEALAVVGPTSSGRASVSSIVGGPVGQVGGHC